MPAGAEERHADRTGGVEADDQPDRQAVDRGEDEEQGEREDRVDPPDQQLDAEAQAELHEDRRKDKAPRQVIEARGRLDEIRRPRP